MKFSVFSLPIFLVIIERICTLSYHHESGSINYYPLFRARSWNNGRRCMSLYILTTWISNHTPSKMWGQITYPLKPQNPYNIIDEIIYPCSDYNFNHVSEKGPWRSFSGEIVHREICNVSITRIRKTKIKMCESFVAVEHYFQLGP